VARFADLESRANAWKKRGLESPKHDFEHPCSARSLCSSKNNFAGATPSSSEPILLWSGHSVTGALKTGHGVTGPQQTTGARGHTQCAPLARPFILSFSVFRPSISASLFAAAALRALHSATFLVLMFPQEPNMSADPLTAAQGQFPAAENSAS